MTAVLERETLTRMDDDVRQALSAAADAVGNGPERLKAAIRLAADRGEKPADITRAIGHVYTYDYVAALVRKHRAAKAQAAAENTG